MNWVLMGLVVGLIVILAAGGCATAPVQQSAAGDPGDARTARELAERARLTIEGFDVGPNNASFNDLIKQARGIFIVPQSIRAAFIFGAAGGSGVLLARDEPHPPRVREVSRTSPPAPRHITSASPTAPGVSTEGRSP